MGSDGGRSAAGSGNPHCHHQKQGSSAGAGFTKREIEYKVSTENNPLVIINGVKSTSEDLKKLPAEKIKHINALHKENAIEKYGDAAKDGAIEVTLK